MTNVTTTILAGCFLGLFCAGGADKAVNSGTADPSLLPAIETPESVLAPPPPPVSDSALQKLSIIPPFSGEPLERGLTDPFDGSSIAGNYLASTFAQRRHNWDDAYRFILSVLNKTPDDLMLQKRGMILAMGAGDFETAYMLAKKVNAAEKDSTLAQLFMAIGAFEKGDFKEVSSLVKAMQGGSISQFMLPLLDTWAAAAQGDDKTEMLSDNTMHLYHAILISDFLGNTGKIENLLKSALKAPGLRAHDKGRIADLYAHIGRSKAAKEIYTAIAAEDPKQKDVMNHKIATLDKGETSKVFKKPDTAAHGLAEALYDMARILYEDFNDDSARIFANLALHLNPGLDYAKLLMGHITARNDQPLEAIAYYKSISPDSDIYMRSRRRAADILEETGNIEGALAALSELARNSGDINALIQMGDIHRRSEDYTAALVRYNQALENLGGKIEDEFWHLHYVLGVTYERLGEWNKAEKELQAALEFRPNHPLVLNYLAYGWAEQGKNLKRARTMLEKAAVLEPADGYIADSLGWVLYKSGEIKASIPHLEKAVELLPYDSVINDHLGDAYWRAGRKLEARFQWQRALTNIESNTTGDTEETRVLRAQVEQKLQSGLAKEHLEREEVAAKNPSEDIDNVAR